MARLLYLRKIREDVIPDLSIICEMNIEENRKLAEYNYNEDCIVGSSIAALIITQISQTRSLHMIYHELLSASGSEIYICNILRRMKK